MLSLHQLKPAKGAVHKSKRLGRGSASGKGGTSTKGNKGHQSRSGFTYKLSHEGGQMPIQRRLPKRGFNNIFRVEYKVFNLCQIDALVKKYNMKVFDLETLYLNKLIDRNDKVKVLAKGVLEEKVDFKINAISDKAKHLIEQKGCKLELT